MIRMYNVPVAADGTIKVPQDMRDELGGESLRDVTFLVRNGAVYLVPNPIAFVEAADPFEPLQNTQSEDIPGFTDSLEDDPRNEHP